jgi:hypothetical protein
MSDPNRKPHARSWLKTLPRTPDEARDAGRDPGCCQSAIFDLLQSHSLREVAEHCIANLGATQTPGGLTEALSKFRTWFQADKDTRERKETLRSIFARADANAKAVAEILAETGASPDAIARANHLVFQTQAAEAGREDKAMFIELEKLRLARDSAEHKARMDEAKVRQKDADLALVNRRVTLLEAKAEEARKTVNDSTLSAAEQAARIREIFKK